MPTREERARKLGVTVAELPPDRRGKHGNHARGATHPRWNGGITRSSHGYVRVQVGPEHPLADPNGYAYLHQLVWFSAQASRDDQDTLVHHRDEDKGNNRLSNLERQTRAAHGEHHIAARERDDRGRLVGMTVLGGRPNKRGGDLAVLDGRRWTETPQRGTRDVHRMTPLGNFHHQSGDQLNAWSS